MEDQCKDSMGILLVGMYNYFNHCGKQYGHFPKLKTEIPYALEIPMLGIYPEKHSNPKRYMQPNIQSSVTTATLWQQSKHPLTSEWIKKIWYTTHTHTHTHTMEYYSDIKKLKFCHLQQHAWTETVLRYLR